HASPASGTARAIRASSAYRWCMATSWGIRTGRFRMADSMVEYTCGIKVRRNYLLFYLCRSFGQHGLDLRPRRQRPVHWRLPTADQVFVGRGEVAAAEEAPVGRQRRGMRRLQHPVPARVDDPALGLGVAAPEHEHRSEEHTSELQSRENLVCRLLLEK